LWPDAVNRGFRWEWLVISSEKPRVATSPDRALRPSVPENCERRFRLWESGLAGDWTRNTINLEVRRYRRA
jgi:hypothetical protein